MPHKRLKVAVIGGGNMGGNHVRKYSDMAETELIAIADPNAKVKELATKHSAKFYKDYVKMLDENEIDAISIVVPTPLHFEVTSEALNRGIHCLLEKPIASTVEEGKKMIELANKNKVVFTVGHIEHYNPVVIKLKELIDKKSIGDITSIVCKRVGGFPPSEPKSDVVLDLAVHDIGIINYLIGKYPKHVHSHASRTLHSQKVDAAEVLLDYGEASGFIQTNWITPIKIRTIAVTGSKGYIEANYITQELNFYEQNMVRVANGFESFVKSLGDPTHYEIKVNFEEPLLREIRNFIDKINGKKVGYLVDPQEAVKALEIALSAVKNYDN